MKTKNILNNFYLLEDIIPILKWITNKTLLFFSFLNKFLSSFYLIEDVVPFVKKVIVFLKKITIKTYFLFVSGVRFIGKSKYFIQEKRAEKQRVKVKNGINIEKYANVARVLHEKKFGLKNSDYNALRINWNLFAEAMKQRFDRTTDTNQFKKNRVKAIRSTYSYDLNKRIIY